MVGRGEAQRLTSRGDHSGEGAGPTQHGARRRLRAGPELDGTVFRIQRLMFAIGVFDHPAAAEPASYSMNVVSPANRAVALAAAEAGSVLLRNVQATQPDVVTPVAQLHRRFRDLRLGPTSRRGRARR